MKKKKTQLLGIVLSAAMLATSVPAPVYAEPTDNVAEEEDSDAAAVQETTDEADAVADDATDDSTAADDATPEEADEQDTADEADAQAAEEGDNVEQIPKPLCHARPQEQLRLYRLLHSWLSFPIVYFCLHHFRQIYQPFGLCQ